jgi:hypothetical protein
LKEHKIKEIRVAINSLIELHSLKFIDDNNTFYYDIKNYMDKLNLLNDDNIILTESLFDNNEPIKDHNPEDKEEVKDPNPAENPCQLDNVVKALQSQLLCSKSENILNFQKMQKETESYIIDEQEDNLNKQIDYMNN